MIFGANSSFWSFFLAVSSDFWCEFIDLVVLFGCHGVTPVTPFKFYRGHHTKRLKSPLFFRDEKVEYNDI